MALLTPPDFPFFSPFCFFPDQGDTVQPGHTPQIARSTDSELSFPHSLPLFDREPDLSHTGAPASGKPPESVPFAFPFPPPPAPWLFFTLFPSRVPSFSQYCETLTSPPPLFKTLISPARLLAGPLHSVDLVIAFVRESPQFRNR